MNHYLYLIVLVIFAGCGVKQMKIKKENDNFQHREIIAKFSDLPDAPFQAQLKDIAINQENHDEIQMFYLIKMPLNDIAIFYEQQMERLGWDLLSESKSKDIVFIYTKPNLVSLILISDDHVSIYLNQKKGIN